MNTKGRKFPFNLKGCPTGGVVAPESAPQSDEVVVFAIYLIAAKAINTTAVGDFRDKLGKFSQFQAK